MVEYIYPHEKEIKLFITIQKITADFPKLEEWKAVAKAEGLWNLFLLKALWGIEFA